MYMMIPQNHDQLLHKVQQEITERQYAIVVEKGTFITQLQLKTKKRAWSHFTVKQTHNNRMRDNKEAFQIEHCAKLAESTFLF